MAGMERREAPQQHPIPASITADENQHLDKNKVILCNFRGSVDLFAVLAKLFETDPCKQAKWRCASRVIPATASA